MTTTTTNIDAVERITSRPEATRLALAAYTSLIADLKNLELDDWDVTTVCAPWTVADMVRHIIGAAKGTATTRELIRQQAYGSRHKAKFSGNALDATNHLQVSDHLGLGPAELIEQLEVIAPAAVRGRMQKAGFVARITVPVAASGSTAPGMPSKLNLGELMRVVYTRDVWLHRIDIARALSRDLVIDPDIDGRIVSDVVREWADRHEDPFDLRLTGPAGGHYVRGSGRPSIEMDAIDFCWVLSGRATRAEENPGAELLTYRVFF